MLQLPCPSQPAPEAAHVGQLRQLHGDGVACTVEGNTAWRAQYLGGGGGERGGLPACTPAPDFSLAAAHLPPWPPPSRRSCAAAAPCPPPSRQACKAAPARPRRPAGWRRPPARWRPARETQEEGAASSAQQGRAALAPCHRRPFLPPAQRASWKKGTRSVRIMCTMSVCVRRPTVNHLRARQLRRASGEGARRKRRATAGDGTSRVHASRERTLSGTEPAAPACARRRGTCLEWRGGQTQEGWLAVSQWSGQRPGPAPPAAAAVHGAHQSTAKVARSNTLDTGPMQAMKVPRPRADQGRGVVR